MQLCEYQRLTNAVVKWCAVSVNSIALKCSLMSNDVTVPAAAGFMIDSECLEYLFFPLLLLSQHMASTLPLSVYSAVIFHVHVLLSCSTHSVLVSCFPLEKQMPPVVCCVFRIAISNLISLGMGGLSVTQIFATGLRNHMK